MSVTTYFQSDQAMTMVPTSESVPAREGVIKFGLDFARTRYISAPMIADVNAWRQICYRLGMIGQAEHRYNGYGFGNISVRHQAVEADGFLITSTQTGGKSSLGPDDYCHVIGCDSDRNTIRAEGVSEPSSEALTHGQVYRIDPEARCVIHAHSPEIWHGAETLGLVQTGAEATYGTPAMAAAVDGLFSESRLSVKRIFVMGGHEDGIICFGSTAEEAGQLLVSTLARALQYHVHDAIV